MTDMTLLPARSQTKLALLNRRWNPAFDYRPLGGASHEKIWPLMYAYRSAIVHGVKLDFAKKLALLKNAEVANALVIDAVKKTIRQAYVEPRLVKDLHDVQVVQGITLATTYQARID